MAPEQVRAVLARDPNRPGLPEVPVLDDVELVTAIADAESEVTGRLAGVYPIPADPEQVAGLVRLVTADIAAYLVALRYRQGDIGAEDVTRLRYDRAVGLLGDVVSGRITLPGPDGEPSAPGGGKVLNPYEGRLWAAADFGIGTASPW